jgi:hypothetical protein
VNEWSAIGRKVAEPRRTAFGWSVGPELIADDSIRSAYASTRPPVSMTSTSWRCGRAARESSRPRRRSRCGQKNTRELSGAGHCGTVRSVSAATGCRSRNGAWSRMVPGPSAGWLIVVAAGRGRVSSAVRSASARSAVRTSSAVLSSPCRRIDGPDPAAADRLAGPCIP